MTRYDAHLSRTCWLSRQAAARTSHNDPPNRLQDLAEMHGVSGKEGEVWSADGPPEQAPKRTEWPELVGKDAVLARGACCKSFFRDPSPRLEG